MVSRLPKHPLGRILGALLIALFLMPAAAVAQTDQGAAPAPAPFNNEQLEQVVAPIALYPDPLIAQILMASTYPLEVVQASRLASATPNLKGTHRREELKEVHRGGRGKALRGFPEGIAQMKEEPGWKANPGRAFPRSEEGVMDAIQRLRAKAHDAGNLKSTSEQIVTVEPAPPQQAPIPPPQPSAPGQPPPTVQQLPAPPPQVITIQPANPQIGRASRR